MKLFNYFTKEKTIFGFVIFGVFLLFTIVVFFLWKEFPLQFSKMIQADKFGQFGDFIGGVVGSIWSLAGVLLFYLALTEQRKDFKTNQEALNLQVDALNQQIQEFQHQRQELENSRKIYEEQSKTLRTQQFESNFYAFMQVYSSIKENFPQTVENDFFKHLFVKIRQDFDPSTSFGSHHDGMVNRYIDLFNENSGFLSHYFKSFYRIVKIIDTHFSLSDDEKTFYMKILRSQLTDYEQLLLYYNSHTIYGKKARPFILKYDILKHIPVFKQPEFAYYASIQNDSVIILFSSWIIKFLKRNVPSFYDIANDTLKVEEECEYFNCIVALNFEEHPMIKIYCNNDIKNNGINLTDIEFQNFIYGLILEKVQFNRYLQDDLIKINKQIIQTENNKVFGFELVSKSRIDI